MGVVDGELVEEEDDDDVVSLAAADSTSLAAAPAAPMKLLRGLVVAAAACPATPATFDKAIAAERRICRCIVESEVMTRGLLREQYQNGSEMPN